MDSIRSTVIPPGRVSTRTDVEMRVWAPGASRVELCVDGHASHAESWPLDGTEAVLRPQLGGLVGAHDLRLRFLDGAGALLGERTHRCEIIESGHRSTGLIDGCWISLYHWSEDEARWFNADLKTLAAADWREQVLAMQRVGINGIVIQNVFESEAYAYQHAQTAEDYPGRAFYPSALFPGRVELGCEDPIEAVLSAADEAGMHVFLGVGLYAWFDFSSESLEWHKRVTRELFERYGHHRSLYSWYVSEEMFGSLYADYPPVPDEKWHDIVDFFVDYTAFVRQLTPTMPVSLAPNNIRFHEFADEWALILRNIDILIPFAFARDLDHLNIAEVAAICREAGTRFWVDMEMFAWPLDDGLVPKTCPDLVEEIAIYRDVEQIYGYQFTGIMNVPSSPFDLGGERAKQLYVDYAGHYQRVVDDGRGSTSRSLALNRKPPRER